MEHPLPEALQELNRRFEQALAEGAAGVAGKRALDEEWWDLLESFLPECVTEFNGGSIELHAEERALVNHALFAHPMLLAEYERALKGTESRDLDLPRHALERAVREALRADRVAELEARMEQLATDLNEWPTLHLHAVRFRDRKVLDAMPHDSARELLQLYTETDERLEEWLATTTPADELREYMQTRLERADAILAPMRDAAGHRAAELESLYSRREVIKGATRVSGRLKPAGQDDSLMQLDSQIAEHTSQHAGELALSEVIAASEAVHDSVAHMLSLQKQRRETEEALAEDRALAGQVSLSDLKRAMRVELRNMRGQMRIAARYAHTEPCAVPCDGLPSASQADCLLAFQRVHELDPTLFTNPSVQRFGAPRLLLWPGTGLGVYDPARNRLVIPRRSSEGIKAAVAHSCALYRIEIDATWHSRSLLESYRCALGAADRRQSNLKLRARLVRDYVSFMTNEAEGRETMPRALRVWFESQIAPRRDHPQLPPEYLGLQPRQVRQRLDALSAVALSADREYRAACLAWLAAPDDADVIRNAALPRIHKAMELAPQVGPYLYSAAVLHMRIKDFQRALELFGRFTASQGPSWWSNKALELCALCR